VGYVPAIVAIRRWYPANHGVGFVCRAYGAHGCLSPEFPALPGWADVWSTALRAFVMRGRTR
jgi:hypothetical protein